MIFFNDLDTLHQFTLARDPHRVPACHTCQSRQQWVSHGFVYKKCLRGEKETVGKRLFCSNRGNKSGCGRTLRLYLATAIPTLHYTCTHLFVFLTALIASLSIQQAYQRATGTDNPRHAYRWLNKLVRQLTRYRARLDYRTSAPADAFAARPRRLQILLPTLQQLFSQQEPNPCAQFQLQQQKGVI